MPVFSCLKFPIYLRLYEAGYSSIVKVMTGGGTGTQSISVYPNLVVNGIINLQLTNQPEGKYNIRPFNKSAQVLIQKQIDHGKGKQHRNFTIRSICPSRSLSTENCRTGGYSNNN